MRRGSDHKSIGTAPVHLGTRMSPVGRLIAGSVVLPLALSGCIGGGGSGDKNGTEPGQPDGRQPGGANAKPIASAPLNIKDGKGRADVMSATRGANNTVTVRVNVVNEGADPFQLYNIFTDPLASKYEANGITLIDAVGNKRYYPLQATDGRCLCTSNGTQLEIVQGKPTEVYATFPAPPPQTKSVTVGVPLAAAFPDIPLGNGPAPPVQGAIDPARVQLAPPKILPMISTAEKGDQATDDDGADERVRLSTDVLFEINKADIKPAAKSTLTEVAQRIDKSPGKVVKVDGHADITGNDAINEPLSQRRAQAVERELQGLVTRQGVTYQSAGHGSRQPIADNSTPEGRTRNRRVTVSFAKPVPPKPPAPPPAPAPPAPGSGPVATVQPKDPKAQNVVLEITEFKRDSAGLVSMRWKQTNNGSTEFWAQTFFNKPTTNVFYFQQSGTHGVTLQDTPNNLRYYTLRDQSGNCVCTGMIFYANSSLSQNESTTYFNTYRLPPELKSVDVEFPGYEVAKNVPIS
jgi:outer membrane protein OmpA-like peptidoglycan-associated protein